MNAKFELGVTVRNRSVVYGPNGSFTFPIGCEFIVLHSYEKDGNILYCLRSKIKLYDEPGFDVIFPESLLE